LVCLLVGPAVQDRLKEQGLREFRHVASVSPPCGWRATETREEVRASLNAVSLHRQQVPRENPKAISHEHPPRLMFDDSAPGHRPSGQPPSQIRTANDEESTG